MPPIISKIILLKGRIPKRWDKNPVQEILPEGRIINRVLLIEGYLHISTFYSGSSWSHLVYIQSGHSPLHFILLSFLIVGSSLWCGFQAETQVSLVVLQGFGILE